jgi:hypothetical protein
VRTSALGGLGAGLARDEPAPTGPTGGRAAHPHLGDIEQAELSAGAEVGDHVGQGVQPDAVLDVQPRSASGRTSPTARVIVGSR